MSIKPSTTKESCAKAGGLLPTTVDEEVGAPPFGAIFFHLSKLFPYDTDDETGN